MTKDEGLPPEEEPDDFGWAWIETIGDRRTLLGASTDSPAQAWALALSASSVCTLAELRAVEARRERGQIEMMPASLELCAAWDEQGREAEWRVYQGAAVTPAEYETLATLEIGSPQGHKGRLH